MSDSISADACGARRAKRRLKPSDLWKRFVFIRSFFLLS
jgi:hypothetical protein